MDKEDSSSSSTSRVKVVIIGAGIAGLSAAQCLLKSGVKDVVILEAKNRTGGRINTVPHGKTVLDLGAQFIHGAKGNPVYEIAMDNNLAVHYDEEDTGHEGGDGANKDGDSSDEDDKADENNLYFTQNGKMIPQNVAMDVLNFLDRTLKEGDKFSRENIATSEDESVGAFIHREFYKYLRTSGDTEEVKSMKEALFNWRLLWERADNACKSLYEVSLYSWGEYLECEGMYLRELKHGFRTILDVILKDIPTESIQLNTQVKRIIWDQSHSKPGTTNMSPFNDQNQNDNTSNTCQAKNGNATVSAKPVKILTSNGVEIHADHVITTCSLGFLKKNAHNLFRPLLPNDKLAVIYRMGFGAVDKIFLEFEKPFWDKDCDGVQFAWNNDEPFTLHCVENKYEGEFLRKEWYRGIQGFDTVYGHPSLLEGWVAGDEAEIMETVPEPVVMDICHELLTRFTGNATIPKPSRIIRTSWHSDEHCWGAYTYIKVGHTAADCQVLGQPLMDQDNIPRVLFAGEATHPQYFSTTHGALLSGQREAQRILSNMAS